MMTAKKTPDADALLRVLPIVSRDVLVSEFIFLGVQFTALILFFLSMFIVFWCVQGFYFHPWLVVAEGLALEFLLITGINFCRGSANPWNIGRLVLSLMIPLELAGIWFSLVRLDFWPGCFLRWPIHAVAFGALAIFMKRRLDEGVEIEERAADSLFQVLRPSALRHAPDSEVPWIKRWLLRPWVVVSVVLVVGSALLRSYLCWQIEDLRAEWRDRGWPVTLEELNRWYPQPPTEQNAAMVVLEAVGLVQPATTRSTDLSFNKKSPFPSGSDPLSRDWMEAARKCNQANQPAVECAARVVRFQKSRYPTDLTQERPMNPPHLLAVRRAAWLAMIAALSRAEDGDVEGAAKAAETIFGVARSLRDEPDVISHSVQLDQSNAALRVVERLLNRRQLDHQQLARLQHAVDDSVPVNSLLRASLSDAVRRMSFAWNATPEKLIGWLGFGAPAANKKIVSFVWHVYMALYHVSGLREIVCLQTMNSAVEMNDILRLDESQWLRRVEEMNARKTNLRGFSISQWGGLNLEQSVKKHINARACRLSLQTAIAIEQYRLDHRRLPENPDQLVPAYLDALPRDPFDGKRLRFKPRERGYVVYSVGQDQADNDGEEFRRGAMVGSNAPDVTVTISR